MHSYEQHLNSGSGRRDLRFKPGVSGERGELSQFQSMDNNDKWEDGDLLDVLDYLMRSKRVRTLGIESCIYMRIV